MQFLIRIFFKNVNQHIRILSYKPLLVPITILEGWWFKTNYISIIIKLVFPTVFWLKNIKCMLAQEPFLSRMCIITCILTKFFLIINDKPSFEWSDCKKAINFLNLVGCVSTTKKKINKSLAYLAINCIVNTSKNEWN